MVSRIRRWYRVHRRSFRWRESRDPYEVLIAELLVKQTGVWKAEAAFHEVLALAPSPQRLAQLNESDLLPVIRPLGLTKRAGLLVELGRELVLRHNGRVPRSDAALMALPGVGRYTAGAVRSFAFGSRVALVDAMTARVYRRVLGLRSTQPAYADDGLWKVVEQVQPVRPRSFHLAVIDFATAVCRTRPRCEACPLADICAYRRAAARPPGRNS
jgi:A/G-specific adenine glycosylase